jgi:uncharacterized protein YdhG (YjbR/CyaY superfamily)
MKTSTAKNIDEFISNYPTDVQTILQELRQTIHKAAPEAKEKISYGIPTFTLHGNLVHFSAYPSHIGFYPGAAPVEQFKKELSAYKTSKGTVQFPLNKPLPLDLISTITKACVQRNQSKASNKKS